MPTESRNLRKQSSAVDVGLKILSTLVIPLILWGVRLEVKNAVQDERIEDLEEDVQRNSGISTSVQQNSLTLVKLETKIDSVGDKIDDIKKLLDANR